MIAVAAAIKGYRVVKTAGGAYDIYKAGKRGTKLTGEAAEKAAKEIAEEAAAMAARIKKDAETLKKLKGGKDGIPWGKLLPSGCENIAKKIQKAIGGTIHRIESKVGNKLLPHPKGFKPSTNYDWLWNYHEVVVKDGRVYDALTGPKGMTIAEYKNLWGVNQDVITFGF